MAAESLIVGVQRLLGQYGIPGSSRDGDDEDLGGGYLLKLPGALVVLRDAMEHYVLGLLRILVDLTDQNIDDIQMQNSPVSEGYVRYSSILAFVASITTIICGCDIDAVVGCGLVEVIAKVLNANRESIKPISTSSMADVQDDDDCVIQELLAIAGNDVSRALLKATSALGYILSFRTWSIASSHDAVESTAVSCCLDILLNELENLDPFVCDIVRDQKATYRTTQSEVQWQHFCEKAVGAEKIASTKAGSSSRKSERSGVKYLRENGTFMVPRPTSPRRDPSSPKDSPTAVASTIRSY